MKKVLIFIWEIVKVVVISLAIIIPIRYYLIQPFFVKGASMQPNFDNGQYLVINEIGYRFENPMRRDVIVFKYPKDPSQYYIKRIIGLPNETIEVKNGQVTVYNIDFPEGVTLDESYISEGIFTQGNIFVKLDENEYFVLGDNRSASSDSRQWGTLAKEYIIGKVWVRAWPFDTFTVF
ncbi:signal peptidase I [Patescibacteria group bacterium]|nr:signal peptidase I [Patescibacteria group bacterium]MBU2472453.1 signal peptidase I [Patescibacteria group bacterium]